MAVSRGLRRFPFNHIPEMVGILTAVHLCSQAVKKGIKRPLRHLGSALVACELRLENSARFSPNESEIPELFCDPAV
jgi:hypothetical protein